MPSVIIFARSTESAFASDRRGAFFAEDKFVAPPLVPAEEGHAAVECGNSTFRSYPSRAVQILSCVDPFCTTVSTHSFA
jgi:hypothetical protein